MNPRALLLPFAALAAVATLLVVQLASGGAKYLPTAGPSACIQQPLPAAATGDLEPVIEDVVVGGVQRAACTLGVSRERLLLALPSAEDRVQLATERGQTERGLDDALKAGMIAEVKRLDAAKRLPPTSSLLDTYASQLGITGIAATAIKQIPANIIDGLLPVSDVLERAIDSLNVEVLLEKMDDPGGLEPALRTAIRDAAIAEAKARLLDQLPDSLRGLLGG